MMLLVVVPRRNKRKLVLPRIKRVLLGHRSEECLASCRLGPASSAETALDSLARTLWKEGIEILELLGSKALPTSLFPSSVAAIAVQQVLTG